MQLDTCSDVRRLTAVTLCTSRTDPERWTNIPLLVKIFKLIINELSTVVEANASRANAADWSQGEYNHSNPSLTLIDLMLVQVLKLVAFLQQDRFFLTHSDHVL